MLSIEEESKRISMNLKDRYIELKRELTDANDLIAVTAKEFKDAAAKGDVRENSAYAEAESKLTKLNTQKLYILKDIEAIESVTTDLRYVPKSYIDIYSTFRLEREDTKEVSTWKVYPGSISDVERGILSSQSPIYTLFQNKESGNSISTTNKTSGEVVKFTVLEVY